MVRGPVTVGSGIKVYWDGDDRWYHAKVTAYDPTTEWCKVLYADGEREEFRLSDVQYRKTWAGKWKKEKHQEEDPGQSSKDNLRYIHTTLVDMADRLPEIAVRKDSRQWWNEWQENVKKAAQSRNLSGLVKLTTTFGEQLKVFDIEGRVDVTTAWWKDQNEEWLAQLKQAVSYETVASRVSELLLKAIHWTTARDLFQLTGGAPPTTQAVDKMRKESKRKGVSTDTTVPESIDREAPNVEEHILGGAQPKGKKSKTTKKSVGGEAAQSTQRRGKKENSDSLNGAGSGKVALLIGNKKRRTGETIDAKEPPQDRDFIKVRDIGRRTPSKSAPISLPADVLSFRAEGGNSKIAAEKLLKESCSIEAAVVGRKSFTRKNKVADEVKIKAGNLCKTFFASEANVIEKKKRGRLNKEQPEAFVELVPPPKKGKGRARSLVTRKHVHIKERGNNQEFVDRVQRGLIAGKSVRKFKGESKAPVSVDATGVAGGEIPLPVPKEKVCEAPVTGVKRASRRKPGRRKDVLPQVDSVSNLEAANESSVDGRARRLSPGPGDAQVKLKLDRVRERVEEVRDDLETKDFSPTCKSEEKVVGGQKKERRNRKRGRPKRLARPQVIEFIHDVSDDSTHTKNDGVMLMEEVETVRPKKRGRQPGQPRKYEVHETWSVPPDSSSAPQQTAIEGEECSIAHELATRGVQLDSDKEVGAPNSSGRGQEDGANAADYLEEGPSKLAASVSQDNTHSAQSMNEDGENATGITLLNSTSKKRGKSGRTRKIGQVEGYNLPEVASTPLSPPLTSVLREDQSRGNAIVSYKRRGRHSKSSVGAPITCQEGNTEEGKVSHIPPTIPAKDGEMATTLSAPILVCSTIRRDETGIALSTPITRSEPVVTGDVPLGVSKSVVADTERKFSRRHFRKSPGRPPRKVVQNERLQLSECSSLSQPVAKPMDSLDSGGNPDASCSVLEDNQLIASYEIETRSNTLEGQISQNAETANSAEIQVKAIVSHNVMHAAEEGALCTAVNGEKSTGDPDLSVRPKRRGGSARSHEPEAVHNTQQGMHNGAVTPPLAGAMNPSGDLGVQKTTEELKARKRRKTGDAEVRVERRVGTRHGAKMISIEDSIKKGLFSKDDQSVVRMESMFKKDTTAIETVADKAGQNGSPVDYHPQVVKNYEQGIEHASVNICTSAIQNQAPEELVATSHGDCHEPATLFHAEEGKDEAGADSQTDSSIKPQMVTKQIACKEQERSQELATSSSDKPCVEMEPVYSSWGDKLPSDSEDDNEILPVSAERTDYSNENNKESRPANLTLASRVLLAGPTPGDQITSPSDHTLADPSLKESSASAVQPPHDIVQCNAGEGPSLVPSVSSGPGRGTIAEASAYANSEPQEEKFVHPDIVCNICNFKDAEDLMLLCEDAQGTGCTCAIHTFCLNPPLQKVPTEAWTCLHCALMVTHMKNVKVCSPKRFPPKRIQAVMGRRSNVVKDEQKGNIHRRMEYLVKWDSLSHRHDTWIDATWFQGERKRFATSFEQKHPFLSKIDVRTEIDDTVVDERRPEWLSFDSIIKCRGKANLHPSQLSGMDWVREGIQFLVKWKGLDYRYATWEDATDSKEMQDAVTCFIQKHESAEEDTIVSPRAESVVSSMSRQPDYIQGGNNSMYGYQLEGVKWLLSNFQSRRSVILADEMGLGKTIQAIAFMSCVRNEKLSNKPMLVIVPKSTLPGWEQELQRWAPKLNAVCYYGDKEHRALIRKYEFYTQSKKPLFEVLLTSYELGTLDNSLLCKFQWASIIVDEGHRVKNMRSKLGILLKEHQADFRLLLTGTPVQNTLGELFALFHFLDPVEFPDPDNAAREFTEVVDENLAGSTDSDAKMERLARFQELLKPRMLRRLKNEVLGEMIPGKKMVEVPCSLTAVQRHLYIAILKKNHKVLNRGVQSGLKRSLNNILTDLKMVCNHPYMFPEKEPQGLEPKEASRMLVEASGKLLFLEKLLPMLKEGGHRVLLFSQMTKMLDILEDFLCIMGLSSLRIDGSTSVADRQKFIADFNHPQSTTFVFLISTRAGGLGINLPSADTVIIYDPDFNPFVDIQAQARAHRIGQEKTVLVYQLVTKCSVEEKILERSRKKLAVEKLVMNAGSKSSKESNETAGDISSILLDGLEKLLDEQNAKATCIEHSDESMRKVLDRSISVSSLNKFDEHGYLGAVQGQVSTQKNGSIRADNSAQEGRWKELLQKLVVQDEEEELGRGKRTRKQVKYSVEQNLDGQEEGQEDDEYDPISSTDDESSSDVSLDADGLMSSSTGRKTADLVLGVEQERKVGGPQKVSTPSVPNLDIGGGPTYISAFPAMAYTSQSLRQSPLFHRLPPTGHVGTFASPLCRQTGMVGGYPGYTGLSGVTPPQVARYPGYIGVAPPQVARSTLSNPSVQTEKTASHQVIGIHLNSLVSLVRGENCSQTAGPPGINSAIAGRSEIPRADKPVQVAGLPGAPTPGPNSAELGFAGPPKGDQSVPFENLPCTPNPCDKSMMQGCSGLSTENSPIPVSGEPSPQSAQSLSHKAASYPTLSTISTTSLDGSSSCSSTKPTAILALPAVIPQTPVSVQIIASAATTRPIQSSAGLKKSARKGQRHWSAILPQGPTAKEGMKPAAAAGPLPLAGSLASTSGKQASQADISVPSASHASAHPVLPETCKPSSASKESALSSSRAEDVGVAGEPKTKTGTFITEIQTPICNSGKSLEEGTAESGARAQSKQTCSTVKPAAGGDAVPDPPAPKVQSHRKPLWVPKGDAGLLMGSMRII